MQGHVLMIYVSVSARRQKEVPLRRTEFGPSRDSAPGSQSEEGKEVNAANQAPSDPPKRAQLNKQQHKININARENGERKVGAPARFSRRAHFKDFLRCAPTFSFCVCEKMRAMPP